MVQALLLLLAVGLIPVLMFAWIYKLTPEGLKRDSEVGAERSYANAAGRKLIFVTIAAVLVGVALFATTYETRVDRESIAVLPFVNMSGDPDNEYFSDGLTDTLLNMLAQLPDLKVAARTSVFVYKETSADIRDIGLQLGVAHVLEGSVQRVGNRVRVTAQLIRVADGFHIWSENYDRQLDDVFEIQDEIASIVGTALVGAIFDTGRAVNPVGVATSDTYAYDLYLRARAASRDRSHGALEQAARLLKEALARDPGFLDAKVELAWNAYMQMQTGLRPAEEAVEDMQALSGQVLEAAPDNVNARFIETFVTMRDGLRHGRSQAWVEARPKFRELVVEHPGDIRLHLIFAHYLENFAEFTEAIEVMRGVAERDPLNPDAYRTMASIYGSMEDFSAARDAIEKSIELAPDSPLSHEVLGQIGLSSGEIPPFVDGYLGAIRSDPQDPELAGALAKVLYAFDIVELADEYLAKVGAVAPSSGILRELELARAVATGDSDAAMATARRAIEDPILDRCCSWIESATYLMRQAQLQGRVAETVEFIDKHMPGFADPENSPAHPWAVMLQLGFVNALAEIWDTDALRAMVRRFEEDRRSVGMSLADYPYINLGLLVFEGRSDEAVAVALNDILDQPVTRVPRWKELFAEPYLADVAADPRVKAELERFAREESRLRAELIAYLDSRL